MTNSALLARRQAKVSQPLKPKKKHQRQDYRNRIRCYGTITHPSALGRLRERGNGDFSVVNPWEVGVARSCLSSPNSQILLTTGLPDLCLYLIGD